jgi:signal transduction histidine kinase/CheY-like chemotaxis protein
MGDFIKRYLLIVVLAFIGVISIVFTVSALRSMNQLAHGQFVSQADADAADVRIEIDHLMLRVKDAANYVSAGEGDMQLAKMRNNVNGSRYVTDIGYISTADLQNRSLMTPALLRARNAAQVRELAAIAQLQPGYTVVIDPDHFPDLFDHTPPNALVMAQSMPRATGDDKLTYVVFDFDRLCRAQTLKGNFSNTWLIHATGPHIDQSCRAPRQPAMLDWLIPAETVTHRIPVTRTVVMQMSTDRVVPMLDSFIVTSLFGLLALLSITVAAWLTHRWRRQSHGELREAMHKAQVSAAAKDEFLANMSHEIRTPLNGILGMAELMGRCNLDETGRRYLDQIRNSGSTLLAILNDVLDLAKIDNGMLAIDPIRTNLYQLFQDILGLYTGKAMEKNVSLLVDIDSAVPKWAMIDPTRLRQIIGNLISNAVKFTENGEVFVHISATANGMRGEELVVAVRDTGIGISPAQQAALFERFAQAEAGTARKFGGTGLGLSITRQLCTLMNGSIALDSREGAGSTFTVRLPLERLDGEQQSASMASVGVGLVTPSPFVRQLVERILVKAGLRIHHFATLADARAALESENALALSGLVIDEAHDIHNAHETWQRISGAKGMVGRGWALLLADQQVHHRYTSFDKALTKPFLPDDLERALGVLIHRNNTEMAAATPAIQPASEANWNPFSADATKTVRFDGKTCLVVDDNAINQMVISELLETFGFSIRTASDGRKALTAAQEHPCDIIMMDCRMPNMDGYEATRQLRAMMRAGQMANTPIVALTANAMKGDSEKCLEAGMDAFLSKPVRLPELVDVLVCLLPLSSAQSDSGDVEWLSDSKGAPAVAAPSPYAPAVSPPAMQPAAIAPAPPPAQPPIMATPPAPAAMAAMMPIPPISAQPAPPPFAPPPIQPAPFMAPPTPAMAPAPSVVPPPVMAQPVAVPPALPPAMAQPAAPPPPAASRSIALFDDETFAALRQTMRAFPMLVDLYRNDTLDYLRQIENAFSVGDKGEAVLPAHTIKSSSKIIGATGMAALAETMEGRLRSGVRDSIEEMNDLAERMKAAYGHTITRIDTLLAQQAA